MLNSTKFDAFANNDLNVVQKVIPELDWAENIL